MYNCIITQSILEQSNIYSVHIQQYSHLLYNIQTIISIPIINNVSYVLHKKILAFNLFFSFQEGETCASIFRKNLDQNLKTFLSGLTHENITVSLYGDCPLNDRIKSKICRRIHLALNFPSACCGESRMCKDHYNCVLNIGNISRKYWGKLGKVQRVHIKNTL